MLTCALPGCGVEFDPGTTRRRYHTEKCQKKAANLRFKGEPSSDKVISSKGRRCSNCKYEGPGRRWAFWWDDYDERERILETAMILCGKCRAPFLRQKAKEESRAGYQWDSHELRTFYID